MKHIDLNIVCQSCSGAGLYVGLAERDGTSVVCSGCKGTGKYAYRFGYEPFETRRPAPESITSVHVARGYVLSPKHSGCTGGVPVGEYEPGMIVPADEALYCPYLYTNQGWCAWNGGTTQAPLLPGDEISDCRYWSDKAECWRLFQAEAPADVKRQIS